jgi:hypothetical protein
MANENEIHQDLGVDLGQGGLRIHNATEASHLRRQPAAAAEQQQQTENKPSVKMTEGEAKRLAITKELVSGTLTPEQHAAKLRELKQSLVAEETPQEQGAFDALPLAEQRDHFGLAAPDVPAFVLETWDETWGGWESTFLSRARNDGIEPGTVKGLRDLAVKLGTRVSMTGVPLDDAELDAALAKFSLSPAQKKGVLEYWRALEGQP